MNDNNIRIIIQAILNQNTAKNIDEQLKQVSSKLQKIDIKVNTEQLRKSIIEYEQWWASALAKEEAQRERVLQSEHKTRRAIDKKQTEEYVQFWKQALDRAEQLDKAHYFALIENKKRAAAEIKRLDDEQAKRIKDQQKLQKMIDGDTMGIGAKIKEMAVSVPLWFAGMTVFMTAVHAITEGFSGMISIEAKMAGYIQTNEKYFVSFNETTHEMILDTQKANAETEKFIQTTHALGAEIDNVLESARLWGRMYKDIGVVQELVRQSTQLSTVDLVGLEEATKMMESTVAQYGVQIHTVNEAQVQGTRILDSWSSVAHKTMAPAKDLGDAFQRTGKIAAETGVSFDFMNGLISAGVRNTALGGANLGNMWKTVLGTIRTDKAVDELERLGVATKELVDGTETWRKAEDILLDLSIAVTEKNYDLTKSYQDISRGVYQFAKLAASLNAGDILLGASASINSTGATMEYLMVQMDTIDRKTAQVKASLLEVFNQAGDDGLRSSIKSILDVIDQLLIGLTKIPHGTFEVTTSILGMVAAYNLLIKPIIAWRTAQIALNASIAVHATVNVAATESMVVFNAAAMATARTVALATGGISLLVAGIAMYVTSLGKEEQAERKATEAAERSMAVKEQQISQYQRQAEFLDKLSAAHDKLTDSLKNQSLTEEQKANISGQLVKVEQALSETVGQAGLERIKAAGFTKASIQTEMDAISNKRQVAISETLQVINIDRQETQSRIVEAKKRIAVLQAEMSMQKAKADKEAGTTGYAIAKKVESLPIIGGFEKWYHDKIPMFGASSPTKENDAYDKMVSESNGLQKTLEDGQKRLDELAQKTTDLTTDAVNDALAGVSGKNTNSGQSYEDRKASFQEKMSNFQHLVNMEADGYSDANGQLAKLQAIRKEFSDLNGDDLYGIDENIYRAQQGIANKAKGIPNAGATPAPFDESQKYQIDDYKNSLRDLDGQLKESESVMTRYKETSAEYRVELGKQVEIAKEKQSLAKDEGIRLRSDISELESQIASTGDQSKKNALLQQLDQAKNNLADLSKAWWDYELNIEQSNKKLKESLFNFSKDWISNEKANMELDYKSKVEIAQMEYDAWVRLQDKKSQYTQENQEEINKNLAEAKHDLDNALVEDGINKSSDALDPYIEKIKNLNKVIDSSHSTNLEKIKAEADLLQAYADEAKQIDTNIISLEKLSETLNVNSDAYHKNQDEIKKQKELRDQNIANIDAENQKLRNQLIEQLKLGYETEKNLQEKQLQNNYDAQVAAINEKTKALENQKSAIDDLIKSLQDQWKAEDDNLKLAELQGEIDNAKSQRNNEIIDASGNKVFTYDVQKVTETEKQLAEERKRISRDTQVKQLEDQKTGLDAQIQTYRDAESALQTSYNNQKQALDNFWSYKLSTNQLQHEADSLISKEGYKNALIDVQKFVDDMSSKYEQLARNAAIAGAAIAASLGGGSFSGGSATSSTLNQAYQSGGLESLASAARGLPSYDKGGWISHDHIAKVHGGEEMIGQDLTASTIAAYGMKPSDVLKNIPNIIGNITGMLTKPFNSSSVGLSSMNQTINVDKFVFPDIKSGDDAKSFMGQLKGFAQKAYFNAQAGEMS